MNTPGEVYFDPVGRFQFERPFDWQVEESADDATVYCRAFPLGTERTGLLIAVSPSPPGTNAQQIHKGRERYYERAELGDLQSTVTFEWAPREGAAVQGTRYTFEDHTGQVVIEESCLILGGEILLVQARWVDGVSSRYQRERLIHLRDTLTVNEAPRHAEPGPEPGSRLWQMQSRQVNASAYPDRGYVDVQYQINLNNVSHRTLPNLQFTLLAHPLTTITLVTIDGQAVQTDETREPGETTLLIDRHVSTGTAIDMQIFYRLDFNKINPHMRMTRRLYLDADALICSTSHWLPLLQTFENASEECYDRKCPLSLSIDLPDGYQVQAPGMVHNMRVGEGRTRHTYESGAGQVPFAGFVAARQVDTRTCSNLNLIVTGHHQVAEALVDQTCQATAAAYQYLCTLIGKPSEDDQVSIAFYPGDVCLGLGSLVLLGRDIGPNTGHLDEELLGQTTAREVIFHEVAHLWFGGVLTAEGPGFSRLHEMLAGYLSLCLLEALADRTAAEAAAHRAWATYCQTIQSPAAEYAGYQGNWHSKWGMVALGALSKALGHKVMQAALQYLFAERYGQCFTEAHLIAALQAAAGPKATSIIERWLPADGKPPVAPDDWRLLLR